mmetsp:Transcript_15398/g.39058  ORF Transcript_15398/g.39058 Transcript_15398/m.39058 type:complete len:231 (-) Transcript_15398:191-883(-)
MFRAARRHAGRARAGRRLGQAEARNRGRRRRQAAQGGAQGGGRPRARAPRLPARVAVAARRRARRGQARGAGRGARGPRRRALLHRPLARRRDGDAGLRGNCHARQEIRAAGASEPEDPPTRRGAARRIAARPRPAARRPGAPGRAQALHLRRAAHRQRGVRAQLRKGLLPGRVVLGRAVGRRCGAAPAAPVHGLPPPARPHHHAQQVQTLWRLSRRGRRHAWGLGAARR